MNNLYTTIVIAVCAIIIIKLFYENKIKQFKKHTNLSELCEKCEFFSKQDTIEIEEL